MADDALPFEVEVRFDSARSGKGNKLLEVKEKFIHLKADLEKQVAQRNAKIQSVEAKLKQREMNLNQRQVELQRKNNEVEGVKDNLASQLDFV